jgi:hypothetical protein
LIARLLVGVGYLFGAVMASEMQEVLNRAEEADRSFRAAMA